MLVQCNGFVNQNLQIIDKYIYIYIMVSLWVKGVSIVCIPAHLGLLWIFFPNDI